MVDIETITFISLLTELKEKSILGFKALSECCAENNKLYLFYDDSHPYVYSCKDFYEGISVEEALTKPKYAISYPLIKRINSTHLDIYQQKWSELESLNKELVDKKKNIVYYKDIFKTIPNAGEYIINIVEQYDNGIINWVFDIKPKNDKSWFIKLDSTGWQINIDIPMELSNEGLKTVDLPIGHKFYDIQHFKDLQRQYEAKEALNK